MTQTVIILLLILLIIIALNYKKISYDKVYKNVLKILKDYISQKMEKKKHIHNKKKEKYKKKSSIKNGKIGEEDEFNKYDEDEDEDNNFILNKVREGTNKDDMDNDSYLSNMSTLEINSIDSINSVGTSLSFN